MSQISQQLQAFKFAELFNQLGWDRLSVGIEKELSGFVYNLQPIAQKRGIQILHCSPDSEGAIPPYAIRQKIERKVTADAREHLIIFTDAAQTGQIWQWVARATGRPTQYREVKWQTGQSTELLEQKLKAISFSLDEEESLNVFGVAERLRGGFDRDNVTKKFYKVFQAQRDAFQKFIDGIPSDDHQRWYTAVVVDRLMFLWFLQEKSFLNGEKRYLRNRLESHIKAAGKISFYKAFLSPLFFRGFAEDRTEANRAAIEREFGKVPYLNGGLFAEHELERQYGEAIDIPDTAFSSLFAFFDEWDWHLDDRPRSEAEAKLRGKTGEINPDVLGYIFEKFVNQKQMGAYYTKEDITEYISKNTIIPALFEKVRADHAAAFDAHAWQLLQEDPRRYVYPAMLHGVDDSYPAEITNGLDTQAPNLLERRKFWNKTAAPNHGLPTEIWRETIARHNRTREILAKLQAGEIKCVADLITYNLNIRQFAQDVIERCTVPALLRAFWVVLAGRLPRKSNEKFRHGMSILDPTCGSGAFLFAALQILKPLYQACLTAMSGALADAYISPSPSGRGAGGDGALADIDEIVKRFQAADVDRVRDYAITKHIIVHNLYGVDIETQATEIAKLRLFLKLVALLEPGDNIEPLPDIDFNIRAGNTLVGYASADETERAVKGATQGNLFSDAWEDIRIRLTAVEQAYNNFQIQQVQRGGHVTAEDKQALGDELHELEEMLNYHLCREYGKDPSKTKQFEEWKASHKPFHWYVDFYPIMAAGGFDVVIGNPPYVEYAKIRSLYQPIQVTCLDAGNLWAFVIERSIKLLNDKARFGLVIPQSISSTYRSESIQNLSLASLDAYLSYYSRRPGKLFDGVDQCICIFMGSKVHGNKNHWHSTGYQRWLTEARAHLFEQIEYSTINAERWHERYRLFPKLGTELEREVLERLYSFPKMSSVMNEDGQPFYVHRISRYFIKATNFVPFFRSDRDGEKRSDDFKLYRAIGDRESTLAVLALNSSLFYWFWRVLFDGYHCGKDNISDFAEISSISGIETTSAKLLLSELMDSYRDNSSRKSTFYKGSGNVEYDEFKIGKSKEILDRIDQCLLKSISFTDEQLDYIINYDIKYRMGLNGQEDDADD